MLCKVSHLSAVLLEASSLAEIASAYTPIECLRGMLNKCLPKANEISEKGKRAK
jgi:hypothetical protein